MPAEKTILDKLLDKMRQQRNEQQQTPETSYFADKPEPDREQERRQADVRRADEARRHAASVEANREGPGRPLTQMEERARDEFKRVTLTKGARRDQEIRLKFQNEETRAAALQLMLDLDEAKIDAAERRYQRQSRVIDVILRMDLRQPTPEDYARDLNRQIREAEEIFERRTKNLQLEADAALADILKVDQQITLGQMPVLLPPFIHRIEDQHVHYPPPGGFNREAYDPWDIGEQFADAAEPNSPEPEASEPDYLSIFEAMARPAQPSPGRDPDGPSFGP